MILLCTICIALFYVMAAGYLVLTFSHEAGACVRACVCVCVREREIKRDTANAVWSVLKGVHSNVSKATIISCCLCESERK